MVTTQHNVTKTYDIRILYVILTHVFWRFVRPMFTIAQITTLNIVRETLKFSLSLIEHCRLYYILTSATSPMITAGRPNRIYSVARARQL